MPELISIETAPRDLVHAAPMTLDAGHLEPLALSAGLRQAGVSHEQTASWPVVKPVTGSYLRKVIGLNKAITPKVLEQAVEDYDPGLEMAAVNLDHQEGGLALGWVHRIWLEAGHVLWAEIGDWSPELVDLVKNKRVRRVSVELTFRHPVTGRPYVDGLAVLGNARAAVKGLGGDLAFPKIFLSANRRFRQATQEKETMSRPTSTPAAEPAADPSPTPAPPAALATPASGSSTPGLADPASQPPAIQLAAPPAGQGVPQPAPIADPTPAIPEPAPTGSPAPAPAESGSLQLSADAEGRITLSTEQLEQVVGQAVDQALATYRQENRQLEVQLAAGRVDAANQRAQGWLDDLGSRLSYDAQQRLRPLLVHLAQQPQRIHLAAADGQTAEYDFGEVLHWALSAQRPLDIAGLGELAHEDHGAGARGDLRSAEQRTLDAQLGISDDEALKLQAKYPTGFAEVR